ncbi:histone deacetylase 9-B isoform X3 [Pangasianodon hypophthalmus]|uniref:histone deacetylase 9-B isoform X3 n=1 Tax=Pangasianodon hypophthalmus TaxID=310915 RepID=UPI002307BA33|nr:histone deacetylase 9-B isoform X3 [Pangasianodon hypophthalmus]
MKMKDGKAEQKYVAHRPLRRIHSHAAVIQRKHVYPPSLPAESHWSHMDIKPEVPLALEPASPLDLRTEVRMPALGSDPNVWERQLQQELLLIQKQQQIQKQLLINEFQKQHENLIRQHQVQLQEHLKLQQELQVMKQRQEQLEKEKKLEQQNQERELERHRRQQQVLILRSKERARESAVASTEVKQKLQEFLLSKSTKDTASNGSCHTFTQNSKLWFTASHHTSLEQSSPPLGGVSPSYKFPLPSLPDCRDDFPLRKTASEPNLKVRSRLKQKVAERRSSPLLRRKEGTIMTPFKKRALELMESSASSSSTGSGPSSPNRASSFPGAENGPSPLPSTTHSEAGEGSGVLPVRQGLPPQLLGPVPLPVSMESKVSSSQQALLQHLLQKEQLRQQKIFSTGQSAGSVHPPSPLAMTERSSGSVRPRLPRHRPLNRTQSAPLPQSILAQLVIQQQHQHFLEKQKQYQQQVHINKLFSKSIEQLRQPNGHLHESEEEEGEDVHDHTMQEDSSPSSGVIRKCSPSRRSSNSSIHSPSLLSEEADAHARVIRIKQEPADSDDETHAKESLAEKKSAYLHQVEGRLVIQAMN